MHQIFLVLCGTFVFGSAATYSTEELRNLSALSPNTPVEWWLKPKKYIDSFYKRLLGVKNFSCAGREKYPDHRVTAHSLPPWKIKVVAAIGDSVTAAYAARDTKYDEDGFNEYPGISFSIGGDANVSEHATLPNFIKYFNPKLKGAYYSNDVTREHFNVAMTGTTSFSLISQAMLLVEKLKDMKDLNPQRDWKLITIASGSNDLCAFCKFRALNAKSFARSLKRTINFLKQKLLNTIVLLVPPIDVSLLTASDPHSRHCKEMHRKFCPCITNVTKEEFKRVYNEYVQVYEYFTSRDKYQDDFFTVIVTEVLNSRHLFKFDDSSSLLLFAPDCFHFSIIGHDRMAKYIWNDLVEPYTNVERDALRLNFFQDLVLRCPDPRSPFIRTPKNTLFRHGIW